MLLIEPREAVTFDLAGIFAGGTGVVYSQSIVALAAHLGVEVDISAAECELLGRLSPGEWVERDSIQDPAGCLGRLLDVGLVVSELPQHANALQCDQRIRDVHWHPLAATLHAFTRWDGVEAVEHMRDNGLDSAAGLRTTLGPQPRHAMEQSAGAAQVPLEWSARGAFDELLARRATCRNFDTERRLPRQLFAQLMQRVFAAQARMQLDDQGEVVFLKKNVPSGGGLHPIDCCLVVQNVEGLDAGLYRYHPVEHALYPVSASVGPLRDFLLEATAGQYWFADAHVAVVLVPSFDRSFWKYRKHAKAYRVVLLEAGHLSQTLYLSATEAGLGAFITGAINEKQLEKAFGIDPVSQGALAICGFGWRGPVMETAELDPAGEVWAQVGGKLNAPKWR